MTPPNRKFSNILNYFLNISSNLQNITNYIRKAGQVSNSNGECTIDRACANKCVGSILLFCDVSNCRIYEKRQVPCAVTLTIESLDPTQETSVVISYTHTHTHFVLNQRKYAQTFKMSSVKMFLLFLRVPEICRESAISLVQSCENSTRKILKSTFCVLRTSS